MVEERTELPEKIYFKIGEVAEIVGVEPYTLRYWETEFPALKPNKSRSQQRLYRKRDVELLLKIKKLLYNDLYTIAGAKRQLIKSGEKSSTPQMDLQLPESVDTGVFQKIEKELLEITNILESFED